MNKELESIFFSRNELLLGKNKLDKIKGTKIAVMGIGGVGSVVCEQLIRLGLKEVMYFARGSYDYGNINRQIPATFQNVKSKVKKIHALSQRLVEINPFIELHIFENDIHLDRVFIERKISEYNPDIIFNCVDEYFAQHTVADIANKLNIPCMIGGVTRIGDEGIVSTFNSNTCDYSNCFKYSQSIKNITIENDIKEKWLLNNKEFLSEDTLKKYSTDSATPYPVITPVPWIVSSFMIKEFINFTLQEDVVRAPNYIYIAPNKNRISIKEFDLNNLDFNYFPWRP